MPTLAFQTTSMAAAAQAQVYTRSNCINSLHMNVPLAAMHEAAGSSKFLETVLGSWWGQFTEKPMFPSPVDSTTIRIMQVHWFPVMSDVEWQTRIDVVVWMPWGTAYCYFYWLSRNWIHLATSPDKPLSLLCLLLPLQISLCPSCASCYLSR